MFALDAGAHAVSAEAHARDAPSAAVSRLRRLVPPPRGLTSWPSSLISSDRTGGRTVSGASLRCHHRAWAHRVRWVKRRSVDRSRQALLPTRERPRRGGRRGARAPAKPMVRSAVRRLLRTRRLRRRRAEAARTVVVRCGPAPWRARCSDDSRDRALQCAPRRSRAVRTRTGAGASGLVSRVRAVRGGCARSDVSHAPRRGSVGQPSGAGRPQSAHTRRPRPHRTGVASALTGGGRPPRAHCADGGRMASLASRLRPSSACLGCARTS